MAIRHYLKDTNTDTGCDASAADGDHDLDQTQGTSTTHTSSLSTGTYTLVRSYQVDISALSYDTGSATWSYSISVNKLTKVDWRIRIIAVRTDCVTGTASGYDEYLVATGTGTKTGSFTYTFPGTASDIRVEIEARETNNHGTREVIFDVQDANSWLDVPEAASSDGEAILTH